MLERHKGAAPNRGLNPAARLQLAIRAVDGQPRHAKLARKLAYRRQPRARWQRTRANAPLNILCELCVKWLRTGAIDSDLHGVPRIVLLCPMCMPISAIVSWIVSVV